MPRARSSPTEPVGTTGISSWSDSPSLRRMRAPLPNSFSTLAMASSRALLRFLSSMVGPLLRSRILRNRSGRKLSRTALGFALLGTAIALVDCEKDAPSPERPERAPLRPAPLDPDATHGPAPPPKLAEELARLQSEAGLGDSDPLPPSGDLKADL